MTSLSLPRWRLPFKSLFRRFLSIAFITAVPLISACTKTNAEKNDHSDHDTLAAMIESDSTESKNDPRFPAGAQHAPLRLQTSPRHAEYVKIGVGNRDSLNAFVVYPERKTGAPVVIVIHEIFGLTTWVKGVADQLAAEGFIAIAPDMVTLKRLSGSPDSMENQEKFRKAVSDLSVKEVRKYLDASVKYGLSLPAASSKFGVVGFCWGGSMAFNYSTTKNLGAAVVYYGASPDSPAFYDSVSAPVLGLYAGNDARVNTTIPFADSAMKAERKTYETYVYDGSGHGFLRQQFGADGANFKATKEAWPATIAWFRRYLEE